MEEEWRPVPGLPTYEASSLGRVAVRGKIRHPRAKSATDDRPVVYVNVGGKPRYWTVGRLVALAFIGPCPPGHETSHLDGNAHNNVPGNLAWETRQQNMARNQANGAQRRAQVHQRAKLTNDNVREIRALRDSGLSNAEVGAMFGVTASNVHAIYRRVTWRTVE